MKRFGNGPRLASILSGAPITLLSGELARNATSVLTQTFDTYVKKDRARENPEAHHSQIPFCLTRN